MDHDLIYIKKTVERILNLLTSEKTDKKLLTAKEVQELTGLDHRTILNRSTLPRSDKRYIPFIKTPNSERKFFERTVIERLFKGRI